MGATAAAVGVSGALSAGTSLAGSSASSSAAKASANEQLQMYQQTRSDLSPYNTAGQNALTSQQNLASTAWGTNWYDYAATKDPSSVLTQSGLEQTPGYQFTLGQGLKSTQSANAAKGLGVSGAALKGAATYATGLASDTYSKRFDEAQTSFTNAINLGNSWQNAQKNQYNMYSTISNLGENAASQTGAQGTQAASNYGNYLTQSGNATAAGYTGASNAVSSGVNNYLGYSMLQSALNNSGTGGYNSSSYQSGANQWDTSGGTPIT